MLNHWTTRETLLFLFLNVVFLFHLESVLVCYKYMNFFGGLDGKESAYNVGDLGLIPGLGRSPREENGNPLQYSCLEKSHGFFSFPPTGLQSMWSQRAGHDCATKHIGP